MQRFGIVLTVVAFGFIVFVAGATVARFELFPYEYLKDSFVAAEALLEPQDDSAVPWGVGAKPAEIEDGAAPPVREPWTGVRRYDPGQAFNGYTVYTPVRWEYPVSLVDMQGKQVHSWQVSLESLQGERDDGLEFKPTESLTVAYPRLFPNGDMLMVLGTAWWTPWGVGIVKVDKDSNLLWKYMKQAHHDLDVDPSGRIYALLHTVVNQPWPGLEYLETPFLDDQVVVLSPDGVEQQTVSVLKAIQNSAYASILMFSPREVPKGDFLHVNSITWLDAQQAAIFPGAAQGDVLISMRQIDVLAVMSLAEGTIKWAQRGPWRFQHDPDILPDGRLLLFDNRGDLKRGGHSRVLEFDPLTLEIFWEYPGSSDERLYTSIFGSQQRLPNGNTLISETNNGRLLEVTRSGDVVWEYLVPERKDKGNGVELAYAVFSERFLPEDLPFLRSGSD